MQSIRLTKEDSRQGYLMLVAPGHPIPGDMCGRDAGSDCGAEQRYPSAFGYMNPEQKSPSAPWHIEPVFEDYPKIRMESEAAGMLKRALWEIRSGSRIVPVSGYRSHEEQIRIWEDTMEKEGEIYTRTYVAKPGCSEHESGLAIDLAENREEIDFICPEFPEDGICGAFRTIAAHYGFIERYPAGKRMVTGIGAEPWHFRYVGVPHAWLMKEKGLILEEYLAYLKSETGPGQPFGIDWGNIRIEVFYLDMEKWPEYTLELPKGVPCWVSGTNEGGIVVSVWRNPDA